MFIDSLLKFSAEQAVTASAASTSYVDTVAVGDAIDSLIAVLKVDTSAGSSGDGASVNFSIQTDDNTSFSSPATLVSTGVLAETVFTSGSSINMTMPKEGMQRYVRGYFTVSGENLTAGAFTAMLVKDTDLG